MFDVLPDSVVRSRAAGTDWALGMRARARALVSEDDDSEPCYREAIERLARSRIVIHLARAHLVSVNGSAADNVGGGAREQLRTAHDMLGAEAFAERARRELLATGGTIRKRTVETLDVLTPQEAQIARLARDGQTDLQARHQLAHNFRRALPDPTPV